MIDAVALGAIRFYRRHVSPRKGFRCAWGAATGRDSCSGVGLRAVRRTGWWRGAQLLRRQFDRCLLASAARAAQAGSDRRLRPLPAQRGDCDLGCDACFDADCLGRAFGALDCLNCCDCGDLPGRRDADFKRRAAAVRERARVRQEARDRRRPGGAGVPAAAAEDTA